MRQMMSLIFAGIIGGMIALGGAVLFQPKTSATIQSNTINQPLNEFAQLTNRQVNQARTVTSTLDFTKASAKATQAVVHITSKKVSDSNKEKTREERIEEFFLGPRGPKLGSGSGVILSHDGYVVTNNHVIEGANQIEVSLSDKREFVATLVGTDPSTDIAVLKIEASGLTFLEKGNSDAVKVGEWVLAVGNPFELTSTVTAGIVSAKGRGIGILEGVGAIESFIQTDAVVNPGNSGGALITTEGRLIGINTAIQSQTGVYAGYSFAVPVNLVERVVDDLIKYGKARRGYLGVQVQDLDKSSANKLGIDLTEGVVVVELTEDGAALTAGIEAGDVITKINDRKVASTPELLEIIGQGRVGEAFAVTVNREGEYKDITVRLKE